MTKKPVKNRLSDKKTKIENILLKMERMNSNTDIRHFMLIEELDTMRNEISRLNETIYEDRRVLADFVTKFFKDTKTVIDPKLGIDGGKKAKGK
jgi:hypothetical protein